MGIIEKFLTVQTDFSEKSRIVHFSQ